MSPASRSVMRWCEALPGLISSRCAMSVVERGACRSARTAARVRRAAGPVRRARARLRPEGGDASGRVDQRRLPWLDVGRGRARPLERRRHQDQPAASQPDRRVADARDADVVVGPEDTRMQVGEQRRRAALGEPAGPVLDVGVEEGPDARPCRLERALPERLDGVGQTPDLSTRMLEPCLVDLLGLRMLGAEQFDVVADLLHRRPPQRIQVVLDPAERTAGRRGEEVRRVAARRDQRHDRPQREPAEPAARPRSHGRCSAAVEGSRRATSERSPPRSARRRSACARGLRRRRRSGSRSGHHDLQRRPVGVGEVHRVVVAVTHAARGRQAASRSRTRSCWRVVAWRRGAGPAAALGRARAGAPADRGTRARRPGRAFRTGPRPSTASYHSSERRRSRTSSET